VFQNYYKSLSGSLFAQAGIGAFYLFVTSGRGVSGLGGLQVLLAVMAAAVGVYLHSGGEGSRPIVLGYEAFAVAAGVYAFSSSQIVIPGTFWAIVTLCRVLPMSEQRIGTACAPQPPPAPSAAGWQTPAANSYRPVPPPPAYGGTGSTRAPAGAADYFGSTSGAACPAAVQTASPPAAAAPGDESQAYQSFAPPPGWQG
jgi:hypothetical protein